MPVTLPSALVRDQNRFMDAARAAAPQIGERYNLDKITFGIEVECYVRSTWYERVIGSRSYSSSSFLGTTLASAGSEETVDGFPPYYSWRYSGDGSLISPPDGGFQGMEFKTIPLAGQGGITEIVKGIRNLKKIGARVNKTCGLHIHIGLPDTANLEAIRRIVALVARYERVLYATTGDIDRENNEYCAPIRDKVKPALAYRKWTRRELRHATAGMSYGEDGEPVSGRGYGGSSKYSALNLNPIAGMGTIEFRLFAGTLNLGKILGHLWCALAIVQKGLTGERCVNPDGWIGDDAEPATSAKALAAAWRSMRVGMGWVGGGKSANGTGKPWGVILPEAELQAPTLEVVNRKLTSLVGEYSQKRFGTRAGLETADLAGV